MSVTQVVTYAAVSWAYVFAQILNIIIITILFFGRNGRIYHSGNRNWNTGFYVAFMIFAIIYLCEPPAWLKELERRKTA